MKSRNKFENYMPFELISKYTLTTVDNGCQGLAASTYLQTAPESGHAGGGGEWPTVLNTCANNSYVLQMIFFVRVTKVIVDS
jgi:hypothetical protein